MIYKQKLDEIRKIAAEKLKRIKEIQKDLECNQALKMYNHFDLVKANNEHIATINEYKKLLDQMEEKGLSETDTYNED